MPLVQIVSDGRGIAEVCSAISGSWGKEVVVSGGGAVGIESSGGSGVSSGGSV